MKKFNDLTNINKAKILFGLFPEELTEVCLSIQRISKHIVDNFDQMKADWGLNSLMTPEFWMSLSQEVARDSNEKCRTNTKKIELLFGGFSAVFSNHCVGEYASKVCKNPDFVNMACAMKYFESDKKFTSKEMIEFSTMEKSLEDYMKSKNIHPLNV